LGWDGGERGEDGDENDDDESVADTDSDVVAGVADESGVRRVSKFGVLGYDVISREFGEGGRSSMGGSKSKEIGACDAWGWFMRNSDMGGRGGSDGGSSEVGENPDTGSGDTDNASDDNCAIVSIKDAPLLLRRCRLTILSRLMLPMKPRVSSAFSFSLSRFSS